MLRQRALLLPHSLLVMLLSNGGGPCETRGPLACTCTIGLGFNFRKMGSWKGEWVQNWELRGGDECLPVIRKHPPPSHPTSKTTTFPGSISAWPERTSLWRYISGLECWWALGSLDRLLSPPQWGQSWKGSSHSQRRQVDEAFFLAPVIVSNSFLKGRPGSVPSHSIFQVLVTAAPHLQGRPPKVITPQTAKWWPFIWCGLCQKTGSWIGIGEVQTSVQP